MLEFKDKIKGKTVVVGIGNPLREDDYAGCFVAELLKGKFPTFIVEVNPEIYIDEIVSLHPDTVLIFDAADFGGRPGEIKIIPEDKIDNYTLSTHTIPISFFVHLLKMKTRSDIVIIGIQPENLGYSEGISETVKKSCRKLAEFLSSLLEEKL